MSSNKYCVIMAGGIGIALLAQEPAVDAQAVPRHSRERANPSSATPTNASQKWFPPENFLVVTNDKYKSLVLEHIPEIGEKQVLCEPVGRNTAPCVAYAAYTLLKRNPDAEMIVTPADHLILNEDDFRAIIAECLDFASEHDALMTVGIKPTRPDTGYGYIQVSDDKPISKVKCFTEKPDLELARVFLQSGEFLLEFGHLRVEGALDRRGLREIPPRAPRALQRRDARHRNRRRAQRRGDRLFGVPRHLDRLRHHGEGRQRLRPLRRVRLERRRDVGFGLPAFAQGPLRQRRARRGLLPLRYAQFDRFAAQRTRSP